MAVRVKVFYPILERIIGKGEPLILNGSTLAECLGDLMRQFPATRELLFDDQGQLLHHLFVYANEEVLNQPGLETPVSEGDTVIIASLITGGSAGADIAVATFCARGNQDYEK